MGIREVRIHQTWGHLEIRTTRPSFEVEHVLPEVRVSNDLPQVSVDASDYRDALGILAPVEFTRATHDEAVQATAEAIAQTAAEGDALQRIENGSAIARLAARKLVPQERDLELVWLPPPEIIVESGVRDPVDVVPGSIDLTHHVAPPQFDYTPTTIEVDTEVRHVNVRA